MEDMMVGDGEIAEWLAMLRNGWRDCRMDGEIAGRMARLQDGGVR
jgi:hypothetical protein